MVNKECRKDQTTKCAEGSSWNFKAEACEKDCTGDDKKQDSHLITECEGDAEPKCIVDGTPAMSKEDCDKRSDSGDSAS